MADYDTPFKPVARLWLDLFTRAGEHRWKLFGQTASYCRQFYTNAHDFAYKLSGESASAIGFVKDARIKCPSFTMTLGKAFELVRLVGPSLYAANPYRHVKPAPPEISANVLALAYGQDAQVIQELLRQRQLPKMAVAELQQTWLNYLPRQTDLKGHSRLGIDESLVTGRGVTWHEMYRPGPSASGFVPFSYNGSPDDLFIDPDAESLFDAAWIAQRVRGPRWKFEREYGLKSGSLKNYARGETSGRQAAVETDQKSIYARKEGLTSEVVTIYKLWSKCGLGHELAAPPSEGIAAGEVEELREGLSQFGDNVFLVLCEGCEWPLNVPPEEVRADGARYTPQEVQDRVRWPVPFYEDSDGWPCSLLDFYPVAKQAWPMAHLKMSLPLLMFLNWSYSMLMGRIYHTSRTLIFYAEHLAEEVKNAVENGGDLSMIPFTEGLINDINKVIQQWQHAPVPIDLWTIIEKAGHEFEKSSGLSELLYGMGGGTQIRSATEAQVRGNASQGLVSAMADTVEDWQSQIARKECLMSRWKVPGQVVSSFLGDDGLIGSLWDQFVATPLDYANPESLTRPTREFEVTIAAGSARKPDLAKDQQDWDQMVQTMAPIAQQEYLQSGDPTILNAVLQGWAQSKQQELPAFPDKTAQYAAMQQQQAMEQQAAQEQQMAAQQQQAAGQQTTDEAAFAA